MTESWISFNFSKKTDFFYFSAWLLLDILLLPTFYKTPTLYFETVNGDSIFGQANQVRFWFVFIFVLINKSAQIG